MERVKIINTLQYPNAPNNDRVFNFYFLLIECLNCFYVCNFYNDNVKMAYGTFRHYLRCNLIIDRTIFLENHFAKAQPNFVELSVQPLNQHQECVWSTCGWIF